MCFSIQCLIVAISYLIFQIVPLLAHYYSPIQIKEHCVKILQLVKQKIISDRIILVS